MAGLELWWLGQAGFRLRDPAGGPTIFCDPYITTSDRRSWQAPVTPVPACHGINVADAYTFGEDLADSGGMVRYLGYVVELGGVRAYHAGDCIPYPGQVERLRALQPHLALLPINGRDFFRETDRNLVGNMDFREAAALANDSGIQLLIPMHWELFAHNRGYPDHLVEFAANYFPHLSVLVMGRGTMFTYVPAASP